ncbi:hypothetical protein ACHAPT_008068 [Fusarium lateritium]
MAAAHGSTTPPPPSRIHSPPTPRLGYQDHWEPFTPRKSARISEQRANRTPSPGASRQPRSPRTAKKTKSTAATPMPSPQKKRQPALDAVRRAVNMGESSQAALGRPTSSATRSAGMLPTPSKTPQKPPNEKTTASIKSIARNLFAEPEVISSPKKRRTKKYTGISMESFTAEEIEDPIEIFTDTRDRIPARDQSNNNPFYGDAPEPEPTKRGKRKVKVPGEGVKTIDEASRREDGMVYVFRGKKFFRKFSEYEAEELDELQADEEDVETYLNRPLTRSAIKPRLLFQKTKTIEEIEEEEAVTDVEDELEEAEVAEIVPQTPQKSKSKERASTPEAPKLPVSPPDTRRITRSINKLLDEGTPIKNPGQRSPFDSWRRTKEPNKESRKRAGESLSPTESKRTRT